MSSSDYKEDLQYLYSALLRHPLILEDQKMRCAFEKLYLSIAAQELEYDSFIDVATELTAFFQDGHTNIEIPYTTQRLLLLEISQRQKSCKVKLYIPNIDDLWFRQMFMADEETMSYNHHWGGTIPFPEEDWADWYDYWVTNPEGKRFYRYLQDETNGEFVGEIAYHYDSERRINIADVIVYAQYRGKGFGEQGLLLLCDAAKANGVEILYDDIAIDNPAIKLFLKVGFYEEYRTDEIIMLKKDL